MAKETETFDERIEAIHACVPHLIPFHVLESACMDMKVSQFNEFEKQVMILDETGNEEGLTSIMSILGK